MQFNETFKRTSFNKDFFVIINKVKSLVTHNSKGMDKFGHDRHVAVVHQRQE